MSPRDKSSWFPAGSFERTRKKDRTKLSEFHSRGGTQDSLIPAVFVSIVTQNGDIVFLFPSLYSLFGFQNGVVKWKAFGVLAHIFMWKISVRPSLLKSAPIFCAFPRPVTILQDAFHSRPSSPLAQQDSPFTPESMRSLSPPTRVLTVSPC